MRPVSPPDKAGPVEKLVGCCVVFHWCCAVLQIMMSAVTEQPGLGAGGKGGLGLLAALESLQVNQQVEMCEAVTGFEQKNKYQICDSRGSQV